MKRAIYFDDRERDLARRVLAVVAAQLYARVDQSLRDYFDELALRWTGDEVEALAAKFDEPTKKKAEKPHA